MKSDIVITFGDEHFLLFPYSYYDTLLPDESVPSSMAFYDQIQDQLDFILQESRTEAVPLPAVWKPIPHDQFPCPGC